MHLLFCLGVPCIKLHLITHHNPSMQSALAHFRCKIFHHADFQCSFFRNYLFTPKSIFTAPEIRFPFPAGMQHCTLSWVWSRSSWERAGNVHNSHIPLETRLSQLHCEKHQLSYTETAGQSSSIPSKPRIRSIYFFFAKQVVKAYNLCFTL